MTASMSSLHRVNPEIRRRHPVAGRPHLRLIEGGAGRATRPSPAVLRRRRLVALVLLVVLVAGAYWGARTAADAPVRPPGTGTLSGPGSTAAGTAPLAGQLRIVQPGETLWSIATELEPGGDPRRLVGELAAINGGSAIEVGQRLVLPDRFGPGSGNLALEGSVPGVASP